MAGEKDSTFEHVAYLAARDAAGRLTPLEEELLVALKALLGAWRSGVDPNGDAVSMAWRAISKAEARKRDESRD